MPYLHKELCVMISYVGIKEVDYEKEEAYKDFHYS